MSFRTGSLSLSFALLLGTLGTACIPESIEPSAGERIEDSLIEDELGEDEEPKPGAPIDERLDQAPEGGEVDEPEIEAPVELAPPAVYTLSNDFSGNAIVVYERAEDGSLSLAGSYETGGLGNSGGLGSQNALIFDEARSLFFAVNAGDSSISMMSLHPDGSLTLDANVAAGGVSPRSITVSGDLVYVVNAGEAETPANIAGFRITGGDLVAIDGATRPLSVANPGPGQIEFTQDASLLIVTEKATNKIDTYRIDDEGRAFGPITQASAGATPFGFAFDDSDHLIVSEAFGGAAGAGAASSYLVDSRFSAVEVVAASVPSEQSAPCWVVIVGDYAYVTNTASDTVSAYALDAAGGLEYTWSAPSGAGPIDATAADDFLYVLNAGDDSFSIYAVDRATGGLTQNPDFPGLPPASVGVAAGPRALYTMSNGIDRNTILAFTRTVDGGLIPLGSIDTGGRGNGAGLGTQGALVFDSDRLFTVNVGDNSITMFAVSVDGRLTFQSRVNSGGVEPVSLTVEGDVVYVVNRGDANTAANVQGFIIASDRLNAIAGATQPLSVANPGPGQVQLTSDGQLLVVTEKATNRILTFPVTDGVIGAAVIQPSLGATPFGFAEDESGHLLVSEAFGGAERQGALSSYMLSAAGTLEVDSASVESAQSAPCWVAIDGDMAYVTNTASNTITAYRIDSGSLTALWSAATGTGPLDLSLSPDGFVYTLNGGDDSVGVFERVDGLLFQRASFQGLPEDAAGIVAR